MPTLPWRQASGGRTVARRPHRWMCASRCPSVDARQTAQSRWRQLNRKRRAKQVLELPRCGEERICNCEQFVPIQLPCRAVQLGYKALKSWAVTLLARPGRRPEAPDMTSGAGSLACENHVPEQRVDL